MKQKIFALFLALMITVAAHAASKPRSTGPTVSVSCSVCAVDEQIVFSGSGFKQGVTVYLTVDGPVSRTLTVMVGSNGGFSMAFGDMVTYNVVGSYVVTAYTVSGKTTAMVASTGFSVQ